MERNYTIPLAVATAIHVGIFFGFPKAHAVVKPAPPPVPAIDVIKLPPPDDDEPVRDRDAVTRTDAPPAPRPTLAERLVVAPNPDDFRMKWKPTAEVNIAGIKEVPPYSGEGLRKEVGDVIPAVWLDNSPRTRSQTPPPYPISAKQGGLEGEVTVEFTVDESGHVLNPRVVTSTDHVFDEPSLRAILRWRFEPGRRGGQVVRFRMAVPIVFKLDHS